MVSALFNGVLGTLLSFVIGMWVLEMNALEVLRSDVASVVAGLAAVFTTLKLERTPWAHRCLMPNQTMTWVIFMIIYFGLMLWIGEPLRDARRFLWMVVPLIMCTGFTIMIFGPIQDRLVWRAQRKSRSAGGSAGS